MLVDVSSGDLITAARQNEINDYIEQGVIRVKTLSLEVTNGQLTDGTDTVTVAQMKSAYDGIVVPNVNNKSGSDCSGIDNAKNRVLTLDAIPTTIFLISYGGQVLTLTNDYTVLGANITFLNNVNNNANILAIYFT